MKIGQEQKPLINSDVGVLSAPKVLHRLREEAEALQPLASA